ncbi:MAG: lipoprotein [Gammaproteobacteria bacterium]|nr:MAG: lipoprotein [Gammaproteobacteria bacterium]
MRRIISIAVITVTLSGCATIFNGASQQVSIRSNQPDVELYVNEALVGKGNTVTTFKKKEEYIITARKEGCNAVSIPASKSFDATTLLGILIDFGLISMLVVDGAGTGAWNKFDQTSYVIDPQCPVKSSFNQFKY